MSDTIVPLEVGPVGVQYVQAVAGGVALSDEKEINILF